LYLPWLVSDLKQIGISFVFSPLAATCRLLNRLLLLSQINQQLRPTPTQASEKAALEEPAAAAGQSGPLKHPLMDLAVRRNFLAQALPD